MIDKINGKGVYDYPGKNNKRKNPAVRAYENTPGTAEAAKRKAGKAHSHADVPDSKEQGVILDLSSKAAKEKGNTAEQKKAGSWTAVLHRLFAPVIKWVKDFWESDGASKTAAAKEDGTETAEITTAKAGQEAETEKTADTELTEPETGTEPETEAELSTETAGRMQKTDEKSAAYEILESELSDDMEELPPLDDWLDEQEDFKSIAEKAAKTGDLKQIEQLLTKNGTRHPAHNSDLLTYYDRRGKIVEMDETERFRVLFGDKNVLKL